MVLLKKWNNNNNKKKQSEGDPSSPKHSVLSMENWSENNRSLLAKHKAVDHSAPPSPSPSPSFPPNNPFNLHAMTKPFILSHPQQPCLPLPPSPSSMPALPLHLADPPFSSSPAYSSSFSPLPFSESSLFSDRVGSPIARTGTPDRFAWFGTTVVEGMLGIGIKLWALWGFRLGSDPWVGANPWGTLGCLQIPMDSKGIISTIHLFFFFLQF